MKYRWAFRVQCVPILLLGLAGSIFLRAQVARDAGNIAGLVADAVTGQPVARATVIARQVANGGSRVVRTERDGTFVVSLLPPSQYELAVSAPELAAASVPVEVRVGETARVVVRLGREQPTFRVEVTAATLPIDFSRTQQASSIGLGRIENLPINRRNYLDFALLTPGVVETSSLVEQSDFRPPLTPASSLGFSGNNGRGNSFSIDGISINGASYNVRPSLPQTAVREFEVNRADYSAELGGASGGAVNIVSRSGGNEFHGGAFGFLRHSSMQARNYFDPAKAPFTRVQSGANFGGPLRRDRSFFYAAFERLDRHESVFVPILQDPTVLNRLTPSQQGLVDFLSGTGSPELAGLAAGLKAALTPASNPLVVRTFQSNSGVFPFASGVNQYSVRVDHRLSKNHQALLRVNGTNENTDNTRFGALVGVSNGSSNRWLDLNLVLGDTWTPSARWVGETRLSVAHSRFRILPNDPVGPELVVEGFGQFGRNSLFPLDQKERYTEIQQNFQYSARRHVLKFGADLNPIYNSSDISTFFSGRFIFGAYIPLSALLDQSSGIPGFSNGLAASLNAAGRPDLARSLAQPISSLQAFTLGLPAAYLQGFGNTAYLSWRQNHTGFVQDSWRATPSLTLNAGLRFQWDDPGVVRSVHSWDPRFGFAYAPGNSSRLVIRGGYGIFTQWVMPPIPFGQVQINRPDAELIVMPLTGVPGIVNPQTGNLLTSADIYQSLLGRGVLGQRPIVPSDLTALGLPPGFRFPEAGGVQRDYTSPYSQQWSLEIERSVGSFALSAGYEFVRTAHLWRVRDHNLAAVGTRPDGWPIFGRVNPALANNYYYESAANAFYSAMVLQVNKRFGRYWGLNAHYTLSRAIDEVTDFNLEYQPHNQLDARADRGLSDFNQKHRFVASAVFESPVTAARGSGVRRHVAAGWTFSPIFRANSSRPFNILTGVDNLGDGQVTTHRPLGLGRNVGIGPNFFTADVRLTRQVPVYGERLRLRLTAEAFNLLNRVNFQTINSVVGDVPLSALPQPLAGRRGNPLDPFSFTSANDPRQIQLGVHLEF